MAHGLQACTWWPRVSTSVDAVRAACPTPCSFYHLHKPTLPLHFRLLCPLVAHPPPPLSPQVQVRNGFVVGSPLAPYSRLLLERYRWRAKQLTDSQFRVKPIVHVASMQPVQLDQFSQHVYEMRAGTKRILEGSEMRMYHYWGDRVGEHLPRPAEQEVEERRRAGTEVERKLKDGSTVVYDEAMLVSEGGREGGMGKGMWEMGMGKEALE